MNDQELADIRAGLNPNPERWWKNRRRHSYISLFGLFFLIVISVGMPHETITAISPLLQSIAWIFGMIILSYILAATAEDISKIKK